MGFGKIIKHWVKIFLWRMSNSGLEVFFYYIAKENTKIENKDIPENIEIERFYFENYKISKEIIYRSFKDRVRKIRLWEKNKNPIYIAYHHKTPAGFICISEKDTTIYRGKLDLGQNDFYLDYVYVSEKFRGMGIAALLRSHAFSEMKLEKDGDCLSYIDAVNDPAISAAKKTGAKFLTLNLAVFLGREPKKMLFNKRLRNIRD